MENTRAAAKAAGEKTYAGAPCKHGHEGLRWVSNKDCVECGKERRRKGNKIAVSKARNEAIRLGAKRYVGEPCAHGHSGLRFTANCMCVECYQKKRGTPEQPYKPRANLGIREAAKAAGAEFYMGEPCARGHSGERYTSNALCVKCGRAKAMAQYDDGETDHNEARRENAFMAEFYPEEFDRQGWRRGKVMEWQDGDDLAWR